mmetsp:Transcript_57072/g.116814  ORF Transcript_57072/g.116814 Transcript_57072/m.116814 type:complete len:258 (-) Transcript_57072:651-1424(-)
MCGCSSFSRLFASCNASLASLMSLSRSTTTFFTTHTNPAPSDARRVVLERNTEPKLPSPSFFLRRTSWLQMRHSQFWMPLRLLIRLPTRMHTIPLKNASSSFNTLLFCVSYSSPMAVTRPQIGSAQYNGMCSRIQNQYTPHAIRITTKHIEMMVHFLCVYAALTWATNFLLCEIGAFVLFFCEFAFDDASPLRESTASSGSFHSGACGFIGSFVRGKTTTSAATDGSTETAARVDICPRTVLCPSAILITATVETMS